MQPPNHPWTATIERLHLCRPTTRRGTKPGIRRSRPITRVASRRCHQVSSVSKQTDINNSNLIQLTSRELGIGRSLREVRLTFVRNSQHHLYADDTQLYVTFPPTDHMQAVARMEACIQGAKTWLCDNGLVMNENKSEAIVIRSPSLRTPITFSRINICGQFVDTSAVIRDLGFAIDTHLLKASQVSNICRGAYYNLSRIAKIRDSLTTSAGADPGFRKRGVQDNV